MEKICGIYKITSPKNRIYIGQSVDIERRFSEYRRLDCKKQTRLYRSFKKYGVDNHRFEVIHQCEPEQLNELEIYYIELFQSFNTNHGLNLLSGGNERRVSEESKRRMSEAKVGMHSGENNPFYGKKHTEETKKRMRENHWSRHGGTAWIKGGTHSEETRKKLSESHKGENSVWFGKRHSEETKRKMSESRKEMLDRRRVALT